MRVALVGNMNNSNFALMRTLRDLGVDAHVLLYTNEAEHFGPAHDTWQLEKWQPFLHPLGISNGGLDALLASPRRVKRALSGYDFAIGNGISPVLFDKMGKKLDIFIPYCEGVEFIVEHHFRWQKPAGTAFSLLRKTMMEVALQRAVRVSITANMHDHSLATFRRLGLTPTQLPIIALYPEQAPPSPELPPRAREHVARMKSSSRVVFSHVSHIWKNLPVPHFMGGVGKRNQWLLQGFAQYAKESGDGDALLCLFEYGRDVDTSKALIDELGITAQVVWFPKMSRREILCVLPHADIGGSEFAGMYWGGCGWEFLASGVPMLHQLNEPETYASPDVPLPPFFNVSSAEEIARVLLENDRAALREKGAACRAWWDAYQGPALGRRHVALIEELRARPS